MSSSRRVFECSGSTLACFTRLRRALTRLCRAEREFARVGRGERADSRGVCPTRCNHASERADNFCARLDIVVVSVDSRIYRAFFAHTRHEMKKNDNR